MKESIEEVQVNLNDTQVDMNGIPRNLDILMQWDQDSPMEEISSSLQDVVNL